MSSVQLATRLRCACLTIALVGCAEAPPPPSPPRDVVLVPRVIPETVGPRPDDEVLRAILPPRWRVGQTWTVETEAWVTPMRLELGRQGGTPVEPYHGLCDYRVESVSDDHAVVVATSRPLKGSRRATGSEVVARYQLAPFRMVQAETQSVADAPRRWRSASEIDPTGQRLWALQEMFMSGPVMAAVPSTARQPRPSMSTPLDQRASVEDGVGVWRWNMDWRWKAQTETVEAMNFRVVRWRPGDPWWALAEALDRSGRPIPQEQARERGRLVAIDGVAVAPLPWTQGP